MPETNMRQIYVAVTPFIILELLLLLAVIYVPEIATILPSQISR